MTESTGVLDNHWNVAQISAMPYCRFNTDFHGDAHDGKGIYAAIPERDVKRRTFERGHGDLVEDRFARQRIHLWSQMEPGASRKNQGLTSFADFTLCQAMAMRN